MKRFKSLLKIGLLLALSTTASLADAQDSDDKDSEPKLTIGSEAPELDIEPVSYTHLTLPTIYSV